MSKPYDDIESVILFQLDKTSKVAKAFSQREFDRLKLGITVEQWILLKIIDEQQPISQKQLADVSYRDPASITRTIDILEKKGYVQRMAIPGNRRQYDLNLSKSGSQFVDQHFPTIQKYRKKSTEGFSNKELKQISEFMVRIQKNMS